MRRGRVIRAKVFVIDGECQYGWYGPREDVRVIDLRVVISASKQATTSQPLQSKPDAEVSIFRYSCRSLRTRYLRHKKW
jgi:hypothetical protein